MDSKNRVERWKLFRKSIKWYNPRHPVSPLTFQRVESLVDSVRQDVVEAAISRLKTRNLDAN